MKRRAVTWVELAKVVFAMVLLITVALVATRFYELGKFSARDTEAKVKLWENMSYSVEYLKDEDTGELNDRVAIHIDRRVVYPQDAFYGMNMLCGPTPPDFTYKLLNLEGVADVSVQPYCIEIKKSRLAPWFYILDSAVRIIAEGTRTPLAPTSAPSSRDCLQSKEAIKELWEQNVKDHAEKKIGGNA